MKKVLLIVFINFIIFSVASSEEWSVNGLLKDGYKITNDEGKDNILIDLKYNSGNPVIHSIQRVSKPGRRIFSSAESLPKVSNGLGIAIISTPKGVMTDQEARKNQVGGEIICKVF